MRLVLALFTALAISALPAEGASRVALSKVATQAGYAERWSPAEGSVVLSRAGMVVVLRPGALVYQVNDHDEVADTLPVYTAGDLYVSSALARHLEALARGLSPAPAGAETVPGNETQAHGSLTLEARQLQGAEAIGVYGTAPAGAPVTITLLAIVSSDIPTVVVSRHDAVTDVSGRFGLIVPIASAYERGTILRVVATSAPGVAPASAQLVVDAPNAGETVPLEQQPHRAR